MEVVWWIIGGLCIAAVVVSLGVLCIGLMVMGAAVGEAEALGGLLANRRKVEPEDLK